jgi:hypothetical protein
MRRRQPIYVLIHAISLIVSVDCLSAAGPLVALLSRPSRAPRCPVVEHLQLSLPLMVV